MQLYHYLKMLFCYGCQPELVAGFGISLQWKFPIGFRQAVNDTLFFAHG